MMSETGRWEPYARAWRRRLVAEEAAHRRSAETARAAARSCAATLVDRFAARRVYLFGSLTGQAAAPFGPHSDVDLAVEGLAVERYWEALGVLESELLSGPRLDLVRLEDASPSLVRRIHESGEVLGERT